ncbi:hypothetical protein AOLI_G00069810 [Acnodon oligacanthus]
MGIFHTDYVLTTTRSYMPDFPVPVKNSHYMKAAPPTFRFPPEEDSFLQGKMGKVSSPFGAEAKTQSLQAELFLFYSSPVSCSAVFVW